VQVSPQIVDDLLHCSAADAEVEEINASILRTKPLSGAERQLYSTGNPPSEQRKAPSSPNSSQRRGYQPSSRQRDSSDCERLRENLRAKQRKIDDLERRVLLLQAQLAASIAEAPQFLALQHQHNLLHARHREALQKNARTQLVFRNIAELATESIDLRPPPPPPKTTVDIDQAISALLDF
jgi:predicted RNase H-like nuclease (RuvC/YqgF family)